MDTTRAPDEREELTNNRGETIAVLVWKDNGNGTRYANIDDGTLIRNPDGTVIAKCQDRAGTVRRYTMPDAVTAFYCLGLSAHRCNGINGWLEFSLMPGSAGCD
ncbi:hypothetical protein [Amycolatopsis sp. NPDC058986]|uniref:hypothetical protein n=1 Tax=unclassified Amycolatopsis TaxID=2618356 RepID=UPI00367100A2